MKPRGQGRPVSLRRVAVGVAVVLALVFAGPLGTYRKPDSPMDFYNDIVSETGEWFVPGECVVVFVEEAAWYIAGPCWSQVTPSRVREVGASVFAGPLLKPHGMVQRILFFFEWYPSVRFCVLAPGHRFGMSSMLKVSTDLRYKPRPPGDSAAGTRRYGDAIYELVPLASIVERRENIARIRDTFDLDNRGEGIRLSEKGAILVREFLRKEEESLPAETPAPE